MSVSAARLVMPGQSERRPQLHQGALDLRERVARGHDLSNYTHPLRRCTYPDDVAKRRLGCPTVMGHIELAVP